MFSWGGGGGRGWRHTACAASCLHQIPRQVGGAQGNSGHKTKQTGPAEQTVRTECCCKTRTSRQLIKPTLGVAFPLGHIMLAGLPSTVVWCQASNVDGFESAFSTEDSAFAMWMCICV